MVDAPGIVRFIKVLRPDDTVAKIVSLIVMVAIVFSSFLFCTANLHVR